MADFNFDEKLSTENNIELFHKHLESIDKDMAALLRKNIGKMLPLPDIGTTQRTQVRQSFNKEIAEALDAVKPEEAEK
jgi:hypothetical protein